MTAAGELSARHVRARLRGRMKSTPQTLGASLLGADECVCPYTMVKGGELPDRPLIAAVEREKMSGL